MDSRIFALGGRVRAVSIRWRAQTQSALLAFLFLSTAILVPATQTEGDGDGDGIPDLWTQRYFGHPTGQEADHSRLGDDPDGDGYMNAEEFFNGTDPTHADTMPEMVVNEGKPNSRTASISIQALSTDYPNIRVSRELFSQDATVLANSGGPVSYTLTDGEGLHHLYLQYADAQGQPRSLSLVKTIQLDTLPPVVDIVSPTNNAVLNQAFITLRAVAADPDPVSPSAMRRLSIWINGQRFWDRSGMNIAIERFPIPGGTNAFTVTLRAEDAAGNSAEVTRTWTVDPSSDRVAPQLSSFNIPANMLLPDVSEVWIEAAVDDENALVSAIVGADGVHTTTNALNVWGRKAEGLVPLELGTNRVTFVASDAGGNKSSNVFRIVRSDRYRAAITSPSFGPFATAPSNTVAGYVSAKIDEGSPTEMRVSAVVINGVAAVLDWAHIDAEGNVPFTTTNAIPLGVPITGRIFGDRTSSDMVNTGQLVGTVFAPARR